MPVAQLLVLYRSAVVGEAKPSERGSTYSTLRPLPAAMFRSPLLLAPALEALVELSAPVKMPVPVPVSVNWMYSYSFVVVLVTFTHRVSADVVVFWSASVTFR